MNSDLAKVDTDLIVTSVKKIKKRLNDEDVINLSELEKEVLIGKEFEYFYVGHEFFVKKILKGDDLKMLAVYIHYINKVKANEMSQSDALNKVSQILGTFYPIFEKK